MTAVLDTTAHPCFNPHAKAKCARVHLPVADKCNVQCNFCNRKYDCANESRPGVTSSLLEPLQAVEYLDMVLKRESRITVAGIAGPGDPFANPERTMETLRLIRERFPALILCVASNGLNISPYVSELAALQVSHLTITLNALDPVIGSQIYAWVRHNRRMFRGIEAARILLDRQLDGIARLKEAGITVKINTIVIPGVNDDHVLDIALKVSELKADVLNCMPLFPVAETPFGILPEPSKEMIQKIRKGAAHFIPQMYHCTRCRSDAVGLLGQDRAAEFSGCLNQAAAGPTHPAQRRPCVAVASWEGVLVNQHLGEATHLWIYKRTDAGYEFLEERATPPAGTGSQRWVDLAGVLSDVSTLLVAGIGAAPNEVLASQGIAVVEMEGLAQEALHLLQRGGDIRALRKRQATGCAGRGGGENAMAGLGQCAGPGTGCG